MMGLKKIPAIIVDYKDVKVWSLRKECKVSIPLVYKKVQSGSVYPYKTVKHKFSFDIPNISVDLEELRDSI